VSSPRRVREQRTGCSSANADAQHKAERNGKFLQQVHRAAQSCSVTLPFGQAYDPNALAHAEFKESGTKDPDFVDGKVGTISCLGNLMYLARGHAERFQQLLAQSIPLVKEVRASNPENPRFAWILGPILWSSPAERGDGQDKAIEATLKGLESARKPKGTVNDPLEPSWGESELLMNLAWYNMNRTAPDLNAADE
jgi:hypothetical protein